MPDAYSQKPNRPLKKCLKILNIRRLITKKDYNIKENEKWVFRTPKE